MQSTRECGDAPRATRLPLCTLPTYTVSIPLRPSCSHCYSPRPVFRGLLRTARLLNRVIGRGTPAAPLPNIIASLRQMSSRPFIPLFHAPSAPHPSHPPPSPRFPISFPRHPRRRDGGGSTWKLATGADGGCLTADGGTTVIERPTQCPAPAAMGRGRRGGGRGGGGCRGNCAAAAAETSEGCLPPLRPCGCSRGLGWAENILQTPEESVASSQRGSAAWERVGSVQIKAAPRSVGPHPHPPAPSPTPPLALGIPCPSGRRSGE